LVEQWRESEKSDRGVINAALAYFNKQPFVYTLQPPLLGRNPVDQFLFDTRRGFCEHYAASFAILMRIAGIPTRIILGYQGGELNPLGSYLIVRQSDAHAWTEVWLDGDGWRRVDPTAAVAPERIEFPIDLERQAEGAAALFRFGELGSLASLIQDFHWLRDSLETQWYKWVEGFTQERQKDLFDLLGLGRLSNYHIAILAIILSLGLTAILFLIGFLRPKPQADLTLAAYLRFRRKLAKAGLTPPPWLGPLDLAEKAKRRFPDQATDIQIIADLYIKLRYGKIVNKQALRILARRVRSIRFST
jgi:hypothetical protein